MVTRVICSHITTDERYRINFPWQYKATFLFLFVSDHQTQKRSRTVVNSRRGQGIQGITCKINQPRMRPKTFYLPFLLKFVKCMDAIYVVQFLYYESMVRILCPKPSVFCANKSSLHSRNIVGILIKFIFFRHGVFLNNHNNIIFTWISCTRNMTIDNKVTDLILTFL